MEKILYLLNSLGDDWHKRRITRCFEHSKDYFTVTFVQDGPRNRDENQAMSALHISCPLPDGDRSRPGDETGFSLPPPKVEIPLSPQNQAITPFNPAPRTEQLVRAQEIMAAFLVGTPLALA
jgi:hypothetical protein